MKLNVTDNCREYVIEEKDVLDDMRHIADLSLIHI